MSLGRQRRHQPPRTDFLARIKASHASQARKKELKDQRDRIWCTLNRLDHLEHILVTYETMLKASGFTRTALLEAVSSPSAETYFSDQLNRHMASQGWNCYCEFRTAVNRRGKLRYYVEVFVSKDQLPFQLFHTLVKNMEGRCWCTGMDCEYCRNCYVSASIPLSPSQRI